MAELEHIHKQTRGWLLPYLLGLDIADVPAGVDDGFPVGFKGHGRWMDWFDACERGTVPEDDIPPIKFSMWPDKADEKHIQKVLKVYVYKGYWYDDAWLMLVRWLLHGFGRRDLEKEVERIPPEVRNTWYVQFNLAHLLNSPIDWSAYVLQGGLPVMKSNGRHKWAKSTAFYSTPMNLCTMMTEMSFAGQDPDYTKVQTVCDPCCGTGSMLLPASNHSLRLYGCDIVHDLVLCSELNGWLWMPWLVYSTPAIRATFEEYDLSVGQEPNVPASPVYLETNPKRVEATQAYRKGKLSQVDFFGAMGVG